MNWKQVSLFGISQAVIGISCVLLLIVFAYFLLFIPQSFVETMMDGLTPSPVSKQILESARALQ